MPSRIIILHSFSLGPSDCCLLPHGCKIATAPPGVMSAFQVGRKGKGKRIKGFLLERFASYSGEKDFLEDMHLHLIGQNCFTWPPLAVRVAGKIEYAFCFQPLSRRNQGEKVEKGFGAADPQCLLHPFALYFTQPMSSACCATGTALRSAKGRQTIRHDPHAEEAYGLVQAMSEGSHERVGSAAPAYLAQDAGGNDRVGGLAR